jgi:hypothetical protein
MHVLSVWISKTTTIFKKIKRKYQHLHDYRVSQIFEPHAPSRYIVYVEVALLVVHGRTVCFDSASTWRAFVTMPFL